MRNPRLCIASLLALAVTPFVAPASANASLTLFQQFNGNYGLSTDGGGSLSSSYNLQAFVPKGATVAGAYLYQANFSVNNNWTNQPVTFNNQQVVFGTPAINVIGNYNLSMTSARADVTSIVAGLVDGGAGGTYDFAVNEGNTGMTDGTALVVVYKDTALAEQTIALFDGYSAVGGDALSMTFDKPLDPTSSDFVADLRLGINFSAGGQSSNVHVNGRTITSAAGNNDDGSASNGALITVGGNDDPYSPQNPSYADDHERYNIAPYITPGDSTIRVTTNNPSRDDNIFLATMVVSGNGKATAVSAVPEPSSWVLMMVGLGAIGASLRRRQRHSMARQAA